MLFVSDETHFNEKNGAPEKTQEKITVAKPTSSNNSVEEEPNKMPENITASEPNEMPTRRYSPHQFRCLMRTGQFSKNTRYIVTDHLDLTKFERTTFNRAGTYLC